MKSKSYFEEKSNTSENQERQKYGGFTKKEMLSKMKTIDDDDPNTCISCGA